MTLANTLLSTQVSNVSVDSWDVYKYPYVSLCRIVNTVRHYWGNVILASITVGLVSITFGMKSWQNSGKSDG